MDGPYFSPSTSITPGHRFGIAVLLVDFPERETIFPAATILLCQFHVAKWLQTAVANPVYEIPKNLRQQVLDVVLLMIHSAVDAYIFCLFYFFFG